MVGGALARLHHEAGVDLRLRTGVAAIEHAHGRVTGVRTVDGDVVEADVVVVGIGAVPATGWLEGAGLRLEDGVVTDDRCRAEGGDGHVWAVGDVARWPSARYGRLLRVEHWTGAMDHAMTVAANLLGGDQVHDPVPYVWSDQFGHKVQALGHVGPDDEVVPLAGDLDGDDWVVGYLRDGHLAGVVGIDQPRTVMRHRRAIQDGATLAELRDGPGRVMGPSAHPGGHLGPCRCRGVVPSVAAGSSQEPAWVDCPRTTSTVSCDLRWWRRAPR